VKGGKLALAVLLAAGLAHSQDAERRKGFSIEITAPADQSFVFGKTKIEATVKIIDPTDVDRRDLGAALSVKLHF